jgi:hypothetical protein
MTAVRQSKLTPRTAKRIVESIREGNYIGASCGTAGIDISTYYKCVASSKSDDAPRGFVQFSEEVAIARTEAENRMVECIRTPADNGSWQAAAWWLERSQPSRWGRQQRILQEDSAPYRQPIEPTDAKAAVMKHFGLSDA